MPAAFEKQAGFRDKSQKESQFQMSKNNIWNAERDQELLILARTMSCDKIAALLSKKLGIRITGNMVIARLWRVRKIRQEGPPVRKKVRRDPRRFPAPPGPVRDFDGLARPFEGIEFDDYPEGGPRPLWLLRNCDCRWQTGDADGDRPALFCSDPTADLIGGRPYCREHAQRALGFGTPCERRAISDALKTSKTSA